MYKSKVASRARVHEGVFRFLNLNTATSNYIPEKFGHIVQVELDGAVFTK